MRWPGHVQGACQAGAVADAAIAVDGVWNVRQNPANHSLDPWDISRGMSRRKLTLHLPGVDLMENSCLQFLHCLPCPLIFWHRCFLDFHSIALAHSRLLLTKNNRVLRPCEPAVDGCDPSELLCMPLLGAFVGMAASNEKVPVSELFMLMRNGTLVSRATGHVRLITCEQLETCYRTNTYW